MGHHRTLMDKVDIQQSWRTLFRYDLVSRDLVDFQPRCDEYQTNRDIFLASIPVVIIKSDEGRVVHTLTGRRFTSVRFQGETDVRTNQCSLSNEEYEEKLKNIFGIQLNQFLDVETIVNNE